MRTLARRALENRHRLSEKSTDAITKDADTILVDGDPTKTMRDVRNVVTVINDGVVIDPRALSRARSITDK